MYTQTPERRRRRELGELVGVGTHTRERERRVVGEIKVVNNMMLLAVVVVAAV